jgi:ABC-2 type transport system ATP-binding protein
MTALIEARGLTKSFGTLRAVDGISLEVPRGQVLGFLGPNGAGKSTTMRLITGFLEPDAGSVRIAGLYTEMTPKGLLTFVAELRGFRGEALAGAVAKAVERTGLGPVLHQTIETLSKGYKRRVGIAQAILHQPEVLIMDEPTDGLDPNQKHQVRELIAEMARDTAIVVSTHILEEVEAVCTRAVVINKGRIVADGTAEDLMKLVPYHGAVTIRVAGDKAEAVRGALSAVAGVKVVETVGSAVDGQLQLRVIPKNGAGIVTEVASAIRQKALAVDEIFVERGKLDDVFRQITSSDLDDRHA